MNARALVTLNDGTKFWASQDQAESIAVLSETRKGGYARIMGYVAKTGRVVPQVYDATITTRFSYAKLVARKLAAIKALSLNDILAYCRDNPKIKAMTVDQLDATFAQRKADEINSLEGKGNDAQRDAHKRCYAHICDGVVAHYVTEDDADGLRQPVLVDGFPVAESIMMNYLEVSKTVREQGQYKVVNSGAPVIISNAIKAALSKQGIRSMKRLALKEGSFERLVIDHETVLPEDVVALQL